MTPRPIVRDASAASARSAVGWVAASITSSRNRTASAAVAASPPVSMVPSSATKRARSIEPRLQDS
jgi:hypothetical protein